MLIKLQVNIHHNNTLSTAPAAVVNIILQKVAGIIKVAVWNEGAQQQTPYLWRHLSQYVILSLAES